MIPSLYYKGKSKGLCDIISTNTPSDSISSLYATASSIVSKTLSVFAPKDHHSPAKSSQVLRSTLTSYLGAT